MLLLCADLGDGQKPLTPAQFRRLRVHVLARPEGEAPAERTLEEADLRALGLEASFARRVAALLDREAALDAYLRVGRELDVSPVTRVSPLYPARLRVLGQDAPRSCSAGAIPPCFKGPPWPWWAAGS